MPGIIIQPIPIPIDSDSNIRLGIISLTLLFTMITTILITITMIAIWIITDNDKWFNRSEKGIIISLIEITLFLLATVLGI